MPDNLRTVLVDGFSIHVTDQGAQAIDKLQRQLSDALTTNTALSTQYDAELASLRTEHERALKGREGQITALQADHSRAVANKDAEIAGMTAGHKAALDAKDAEIAGLQAGHKAVLEAKDAEIADAKAQVPDGSAMDALISERSGLIGAAKRFLGDAFDPTGKSNAEIRRFAVAKGIGDQAAAAMQDDHVRIAFDTMVKLAPATQRDPIRDALRMPPPGSAPAGGAPAGTSGNAIADARMAAADARRKHLESLENAWRPAAA